MCLFGRVESFRMGSALGTREVVATGEKREGDEPRECGEVWLGTSGDCWRWGGDERLPACPVLPVLPALVTCMSGYLPCKAVSIQWYKCSHCCVHTVACRQQYTLTNGRQIQIGMQKEVDSRRMPCCKPDQSGMRENYSLYSSVGDEFCSIYTQSVRSHAPVVLCG